jgi:hypothetical protein
MKERFNPFIIRRLKQIDDLVDEVYHDVTPCDYDEDKFYMYFREITNWVVENFVNNNNLGDDDIAIDLHHFIRERYFDEFLDYFDNAQLSCDEFINESEDLGDFNYTKDERVNLLGSLSNPKSVTPSDLKKIEFIADYIEMVSGEYLNRSNYKPCFVSVQAGHNKFYIVVIVTDRKYTLEGYEKFINEKLHKTFKGMDIYVLLIDNKYDDGNSIPKSCDDYFNHIPKLPNTITIKF